MRVLATSNDVDFLFLKLGMKRKLPTQKQQAKWLDIGIFCLSILALVSALFLAMSYTNDAQMLNDRKKAPKKQGVS